MRARPLTLIVLLAGLLAVSTGSIFVRFAQRTAPSATVAAGRLVFASLALAPLALGRHRVTLARLGRREMGLALLSGAFLAGHFGFWITSLEHTTVARSVVLVTTTPLWVGLLSPLVLREPITRRVALGILLALAGSAVVGIGDAAGGLGAAGRGAVAAGARTATPQGDLMALAGAWMMAGYLLAGRRLRAGLPLVPYVFLVYGMAAMVLVIVMAASGRSLLGLEPGTYLWLVLLALVPQLVGHTSYNWALRYLPASFVALAMLGEPVGSAALARIFLHEIPTPLEMGGAALILAGIALAALEAPRAEAENPRGA